MHDPCASIRADLDNAPRFELPPDNDERAQFAAQTETFDDLVNPMILFGIEPPDLQWIIPEWLPRKTVTSLPGPGGVGKTLLSQQLQIATSIGALFAGLQTTRCKSLAFYCEDDKDELHRRGRNICRHYGIDFKALGNARWQGRFGKSNVLVTFNKLGLIVTTPFFDFVMETMRRTGADLLILDNAAQLFGGNENDRSQVTQFVNKIGEIAVTFNAAVLLLSHPGKAETGATSEYSGSTAWDAAVRCRWQFVRPTPDKDEDARDYVDLRILRKTKANYSTIGDEISLKWDNGAFSVNGTHGKNTIDRIEDHNIEKIFLDVLRKSNAQNVHVSANPRGIYAPKELKQKFPAETKSLKFRQLEVAMNQLLGSGRIVQETVGPASRNKFRLVEAQL